MKEEITAVAMASMERLGAKSPASMVATNTYLLKDIAELLRTRSASVICSGGSGGLSGIVKSTEILDVVTMRWRAGPDMKDVRREHGIATVGGRVFAIGGTNAGGTTRSVEAFDVQKNEWAEVQPMNAPRNRPGVGVVGGKIIVMGGNSTGGFTASCEALDVDGGEWETVPAMPTERYEFGVAVIGDRVFAIGGYNNRQVSCVEVFDAGRNEWEKLSPMPTPRQAMAIALVEDRFIWAIGGYRNGQVLDVIEVFDAVENSWTTPDVKMPMPRGFMGQAIVIGDEVLIIGGCTTGFKAVGRVDIINVKSFKWTVAQKPMEIARMWHAVAEF